MKSTLSMKLIGIILSKNKYPLDALADVNVELGIIAYKPENPYPPKEEGAGHKIYCKVIDAAKDNHKRLIELNKQTRYLLDGRILSAAKKGKLLEKIGYEVI